MPSNSLLASSNYVVRIRCLLSPNHTTPASLLTESLNNNLRMSTATKALPTSNPFGLATSTSQTSCNICQRLLYSFEEILVCRLCRGSYHWRCVKPDPISHYGENANFTCAQCIDNMKATTSNTTYRLSNGNLKIKSLDSSEMNYRNYAYVPSKSNTMATRDTPAVNGIRRFEEKQQQQQQSLTLAESEVNESNDRVQSQMNGRYIDDSKTISQIQERQIPIESADENTITTEMFQAHYQYTPLTEFAATRTDPTTNETISYINQSSLSNDSDRQLSARYVCNAPYTSNDYEPTKSRLTTSTLDNSPCSRCPPADNSLNPNRQQYFISTTNLNVNDGTYRREQQQNMRKNPINYSTSYLPQLRDDDFSSFKYSYLIQTADRNSAVGSDSGIVMNQPSHHHGPKENIQITDPKFSAIVEQLERQLENDTTKLNEKLETKLKSLETMIDKQTVIIDKQDKVIENLKEKICKIETERNHFRDRLSTHDKHQRDDKKPFEQYDVQHTIDDVSTHRKSSTTSSIATDNGKRPSKKPPAPKLDLNGSLNASDNESVLAKLIDSHPVNQQRTSSDASHATPAAILAAHVPLVEQPALSDHFNNTIHQSDSDDISYSKSAQYKLAELQDQSSQQRIDESVVEENLGTSTHHEDQTDVMNTSNTKKDRSSSLSTTASVSGRQDADITSGNSNLLPARNSTTHRSLEELSRKTSQDERNSRLGNKATSLEFPQRPVQYENPGSIYFDTQNAPPPAAQFQNTMKGNLTKKNPDSFLKRTERYYCVLADNTLLMYKRENDKTACKGIQLKGAKVSVVNDSKRGEVIELRWSLQPNKTKRYQLQASNPQETQKWLESIEASMRNP